MDVPQFKAACDAILTNSSDPAAVSAGLAELLDAFTLAVADRIQAGAQIEDLARQNDALRQTNMDLFLKIPVTGSSEKTPEEPEEEKPTFEALFKDGVLI